MSTNESSGSIVVFYPTLIAKNKPDDISQWIRLNVGGTVFQTTRMTLMSYPESMLGCMFGISSNDNEPMWNSMRDSSGAYLIDRSPKYFEPILNYLRYGKLIVDDGINLAGVIEEARYFNLSSLLDILEQRVKNPDRAIENRPLCRSQVVAFLLQTPFNKDQQLRFQGVNLTNCNLSRLDLRNGNFKYAELSGANLSNCNLTGANLERANLMGAILDGAQLVTVKLACANLENASMKKCNFEDPHQRAAILEGCNMKGVDLENCDFFGSDLQEANLRGANFVNTAFDHMINPVHMSQALPMN